MQGRHVFCGSHVTFATYNLRKKLLVPSRPSICREELLILDHVEVIDRNGRAGWWRREGRSSRSFKYFDAEGKLVRKKEDLERIKALVIPPAWKSVRICPRAGGKLQAIGVDVAGRIQYRYHQKFADRQQKKKFAKIEKFGKFLPALRARTNRDIRLKGFPREKVLAIMIRLVNSLYMRVGGEASVKSFRTYGITTLANNHLTIRNGCELVFDYVGKSHIRHRKVLVDKKLAELISNLRRLGTSKKLFHYLDENGEPHSIKPAELNNYLKAATAPEFSLKDFRTWGASVLAAVSLAEMGPAETQTQIKKNIVKAIKHVAEELGNTPAVCRASYIHPLILSAYERGTTISDFRPRSQRSVKKFARLEPEEKALLRLFKSGRTQ
ncbi:MAG: DNA topoisomerase IB [Pyrinomonadaceae bacterium]